MEIETIRDLGIALGLGLIVGLQRERSGGEVAGIRTFAIMTLLGALCGLIARESGSGLVVAAGLLAVAAIFWIGNRVRLEAGSADAGMTTEVAGLTMFAVGAAVTLVHPAIGVVTTGAVAVLLQWKEPLHHLVDRMGEEDVRAIVRLAIIGMVILPVLPDEAYGPYDVLNPFRIWLMVVLIVGISMAAYVAQRVLGTQAGTILAGVFGGLISSTATTVSFARRSRSSDAETTFAALVIMIASTVVFGRVLLEIAIVAPSLLRSVAPPVAALMLLMAIASTVAFLAARSRFSAPEAGSPPSDLKAAIMFGALYAAVLLGVAFVQDHFGDAGTYVVAAISGLTDMDAITLSSAQLMKSGSLEVSTGWRLIVVGSMANLVFKLGVIAALGPRRLLARIAVLFAIGLAGGTGLLLFWPG